MLLTVVISRYAIFQTLYFSTLEAVLKTALYGQQTTNQLKLSHRVTKFVQLGSFQLWDLCINIIEWFIMIVYPIKEINFGLVFHVLCSFKSA